MNRLSPSQEIERAIASGAYETARVARAQAAELARLQGYGLTPRRDCGLHFTELDGAETWVEYEWDADAPALFAVTGVLVNGRLIDAARIDGDTVGRWKTEIVEARDADAQASLEPAEAEE